MTNHNREGERFSFMNHLPGEQARLSRILEEFEKGSEFLQKFKRDRVVTVFGSHTQDENSPIYKQAREFGRELAQNGFAAATGGGPGVMAAVNRGVSESGGKSAGLCIQLPQTRREEKNEYLTDSQDFYYFFVRKVMLARIGMAYVFFPGGLGTLDEFFEISTLVATRKFHRHIPIILVGKLYWQSLIDWMRTVPMAKYRAFKEEELQLWHLVDSADEAIELIMASHS